MKAALAGCLDAAVHAACAARHHAPLAPPRAALPASLAEIAALAARGACGRIVLAEGGYEALRIILARLGGEDALVLEHSLHRAFDAALALAFGLALARAEAAVRSDVGAQVCVALALAVLAVSRTATPPRERRALLEAAADIAATLAAAAPQDRDCIAALMSAYAEHLRLGGPVQYAERNPLVAQTLEIRHAARRLR